MVWLERNGRIRYRHSDGYDWLARREAFAFDRCKEMVGRFYAFRWVNQGPLAEQYAMAET